MEISDEKVKEYARKLILSRMRILINDGFFGLLLMNVPFALDTGIKTAATDGEKIYFSPAFLESLSDKETDFVLKHEIMHVALRHCERLTAFDPFLSNVACDIVVNSNILKANDMNVDSISVHGVASMHFAPNGKEGYEYSAEEVYEMLSPEIRNKTKKSSSAGKTNGSNGVGGGKFKGNGYGTAGSGSSAPGGGKFEDDHSKWKTVNEKNEELKEVWLNRIKEAAKAVEIRASVRNRGKIPMFAKRILKESLSSAVDWRAVLADFVQTEPCDYGFLPPDRRFADGDFILPDFSETEERVEKLLFMIDTSGSMTDDEVSDAYFEIKRAISCFAGKLEGWLGFFDAAVIKPEAFKDVEDFLKIKAVGGGGTSFKVIFDYVAKNMADDLPVAIIILTDGYAPFPDEKLALGIPVLWIINNDKITPPWGKVARILPSF